MITMGRALPLYVALEEVTKILLLWSVSSLSLRISDFFVLSPTRVHITGSAITFISVSTLVEAKALYE